MTDRAQPAAAADQLLALLQRHREALLRVDPAAIAELEACTRDLEQTLATLASLAGNGRPAARTLPGLTLADVARLQAELQRNQATLVQIAAVNRRALNALFGEPQLYSR